MGCALSLFGRDMVRIAAVAETCPPEATVEIFGRDVTDASAMSTTLSELDSRRAVDVNLLGVINMVVPLTERLCARGHGHIVIVGSMAGMQGLAESPVYSATKAAIRIYREGLRRLLAPKNVRVTVVVPGFIATPMSRSLPFPRPFEWSAERAATRIARGIESNEAEVVFPWQLRIIGGAIRLMPLRLRDSVLDFSRSWTGYRG